MHTAHQLIYMFRWLQKGLSGFKAWSHTLGMTVASVLTVQDSIDISNKGIHSAELSDPGWANAQSTLHVPDTEHSPGLGMADAECVHSESLDGWK